MSAPHRTAESERLRSRRIGGEAIRGSKQRLVQLGRRRSTIQADRVYCLIGEARIKTVRTGRHRLVLVRSLLELLDAVRVLIGIRFRTSTSSIGLLGLALTLKTEGRARAAGTHDRVRLAKVRLIFSVKA